MSDEEPQYWDAEPRGNHTRSTCLDTLPTHIVLLLAGEKSASFLSKFAAVYSAHPEDRAAQVAWDGCMDHDDLVKEINRRADTGIDTSDLYVKTGRHGGPHLTSSDHINHASRPFEREVDEYFYDEDCHGLASRIEVLNMNKSMDYRRAKELDRDPTKTGIMAWCFGKDSETFQGALADDPA